MVRGRLGQRRDQDLRRGRAQGGDIVVLGQPQAVIAEPLGGAGDLEGLAHGLRLRGVAGDGRQVERGEDHGLALKWERASLVQVLPGVGAVELADAQASQSRPSMMRALIAIRSWAPSRLCQWVVTPQVLQRWKASIRSPQT